jgi:hypothetical protein
LRIRICLLELRDILPKKLGTNTAHFVKRIFSSVDRCQVDASRGEEYHSLVRKNIVSELNRRVEHGPRKRNFLILDDDSVLDPEACRAMHCF